MGLIGLYSKYQIPNVTIKKTSFSFGDTEVLSILVSIMALRLIVPPLVLLNDNHVKHRMRVTPAGEKLNLRSIVSLFGFKNETMFQPEQIYVGQSLPKFILTETLNVH